EQTIGRTPRAGTAARRSQPGDLGGGAEAGGVFVGGGQIGQAVRGAQPAGEGDAGGQASGLKTRSELTSGKGDFPTKAARRQESNARTVLAVKGSLRRAKTGRALDCSGPFRRKYRCDGRLRRENHQDPAVCSDATIDQRSTGRSSLPWDCTTEARLPMCQLVCFENLWVGLGTFEEIRERIGGSEPFCIRRDFALSENQNKSFLRRKDKRHSAASRWSGPSRTGHKETEQSLPELAAARQDSRQRRIADPQQVGLVRG